jgi:hypothetical protein
VAEPNTQRERNLVERNAREAAYLAEAYASGDEDRINRALLTVQYYRHPMTKFFLGVKEWEKRRAELRPGY